MDLKTLSNQFSAVLPTTGGSLSGPLGKSSSNQMSGAIDHDNAAQKLAADTEAYGGSSVHPTTLSFPQVGRSKGYMVGGANDYSGNRIAGHVVAGEFSATKAGVHIIRTANQTKGRKDIYAGAWKDDNGAVVTDASTRIRQHDKAVRLGDDRGEDAIFGLQKGNEILLKAGKAKKAAKAA